MNGRREEGRDDQKTYELVRMEFIFLRGLVVLLTRNSIMGIDGDILC